MIYYGTFLFAKNGTFLLDSYRLLATDKDHYWTINLEADDLFVKGIYTGTTPPKAAYKLTKAARYHAGSKRMWHWEVDGV